MKMFRTKVASLAARNEKGFSLVEVISVLLVLSVLTAVVFARYMSADTAGTAAQASVLKNSIRYAQSRAMKLGNPDDPLTIWGIKSAGSQLWLFRTTTPDDAANMVYLPTESSNRVNLTTRKVTATDFTLFFDSSGRPYTAYTDKTTNTPVSQGNPVTIVVSSTAGGTPVSFDVTPETGFIQ
jgi:prepilin-type N-terminal cleavage/methylation domain-containing protein